MADESNIPSYDFSHKYRGYAVIIVNENFYDGNIPDEEYKRKGADKDLKKMTDMFKALDFKVKAYKDLNGKEIRGKIEKASQKKEFNKKSDCFALVISSHGEEVEEKKDRKIPENAKVWRHSVLASDKDKVYIDEIMSYFEDSKAEGLKGKPKLFFIQACRSRHGNIDKRFDYGTFIKVVVERKFNVQPSDAMDHEDNGLFDDLDSIEMEDIYKDLADSDAEDEWDGVMETDDDESIIDSDEDISDAKGGPDSGQMPRSPSPEPEPEQLQYPQQPQDEQEVPNLLTPNLPKRDDKAVGQLNESTRNIQGGAGDQGRGDKADAGGSSDSGVIPMSPYDIVPINCPQDCLIVYPSQPGALAFRRADVGSRFLHCLHKTKNLEKLVKGCDLLQYLTEVAGDMAMIDITFDPSNYPNAKELKENMPFKVSSVITHRLTGPVVLKPKVQNSYMAGLLEKLKKLFS